LSRRRFTTDESGLTLLELLVALALAALVGVAVFVMHRSAMGAYDQVRQVRRSEFGIRVLIDVLTDDLRSVYAYGGDDENFFFIGSKPGDSEASFLEFSTTASLDLLARPESTEVRRVRYVLTEGSDSDLFNIVREERPYCGVAMDIADEDWSSVILVQDVAEVTAGYYDDLTSSFMENWMSDPSQTNRPMRPGAMKLSVAMPGNRQPWELLIKLPPIRLLARESL